MANNYRPDALYAEKLLTAKSAKKGREGRYKGLEIGS
jgi:hypothetical protein